MAVNIARVAKLYSEYQVEARRFMGACVKNVYIKVEVKNATIPKRISTKITNTEMISCTGSNRRHEDFRHYECGIKVSSSRQYIL